MIDLQYIISQMCDWLNEKNFLHEPWLKIIFCCQPIHDTVSAAVSDLKKYRNSFMMT